MKTKLFYGTLSTLGMSVVSMSTNVILTGFIVRSFSTFDSGLWFSIFSIVVLLSFCDFGFASAVTRETGMAFHKTNKLIRINNLYSTLTKIMYFFSLLAIILAMLFYLFFLRSHQVGSHHLLLAYSVFCVGFYFRMIANSPLAIIQGLGEVALQANLQSMSFLISFVCSLFAIYHGDGLLGLAVSYCFSYVFLFVSAKLYAERKLRVSLRYPVCYVLVKRIFPVAANWTLMNVGAILVLQIPTMIILKMIGPSAVTGFAVSRQLCVATLTISTIIGNSAMPFISQEFGRGGVAQVHGLLNYVVKYSTLAAILLAITIFAMRHEIAHLWFGNKHVINYEVLAILLSAIILEAHHVSITKVCISSGHIKFAKVALSAGFLTILLGIVLIKHWGIVGAAWSVLVSQLLTNNWYAVYAMIRYIRLPVRAYLRLMTQLVVIGAILSAEAWLLSWIRLGSDIGLILINAVLLTLLTLALLLFSAPERAQFKSLCHALLGKK